MEGRLSDLFKIDEEHPPIDGSDIEIRMGVPAQYLVEITSRDEVRYSADSGCVNKPEKS